VKFLQIEKLFFCYSSM